MLTIIFANNLYFPHQLWMELTTTVILVRIFWDANATNSGNPFYFIKFESFEVEFTIKKKEYSYASISTFKCVFF